MLDSGREFFYKRRAGVALRGPASRHLTPRDAQVAQLVEQRTENPRVGGSNPPLGTTLFQRDQEFFLDCPCGVPTFGRGTNDWAS